jgi:hypothetical protein
MHNDVAVIKNLLIAAVIVCAMVAAYKIGMYNNYDYEARYGTAAKK